MLRSLAALILFTPALALAGPPKSINGLWGIDPEIGHAPVIMAYGCETAPTRMSLIEGGVKLEMVRATDSVRRAKIIDFGVNTLHFRIEGADTVTTIALLDEDHFITYPYRGDKTPKSAPKPEDADNSAGPRRVVTDSFSVAAPKWRRCSPSVS